MKVTTLNNRFPMYMKQPSPGDDAIHNFHSYRQKVIAWLQNIKFSLTVLLDTNVDDWWF
jgi:hypothetical protein